MRSGTIVFLHSLMVVVLFAVIPRCGPHQFMCTNRQCVPYHGRCDAVKDCVDGSDESLCGKYYYNVRRNDMPSHADIRYS